MSATSCFYLLDLWHSDNEQAHSVIGTAAVCPVEMHTSRLETVSLHLTLLHRLCLTLLGLSVLLLAHTPACMQVSKRQSTGGVGEGFIQICSADIAVLLLVWGCVFVSLCVLCF